MWFFKEDKDKTAYPTDYNILCGIEEEFLIVKKDGTLLEAADEIMVESAKLLDRDPAFLEKIKINIRGLDAEPSPTQIEYVTHPLPLEVVSEAIELGRRLLIEAAKKVNCKILAQSMHPIESNPNPIAGTHLNISAQKKGALMMPNDMKIIYNYFWNMLPELIGISANSPIYLGDYNQIKSNRNARSTVLKMNGIAKFEVPDDRPALIPMQYYGRRRYRLKISGGKEEIAKRVVMNSKGKRLVDISARGPSTNISDDKDESPYRNRIEIRIFDIQPDIHYLTQIVNLLSASALHALHLNDYGHFEFDSQHKANLESAIRLGQEAEFHHNTGEISLHKSITHWISELRPYAQHLKINLDEFPKSVESRISQPPIDIHFSTRSLEQLRQEGRIYVDVQISQKQIVSDSKGRQYKVPKGSKIHGKLIAGYDLSYHEENYMITRFDKIDVKNYLQVQGLNIPLVENDRILRAISKSEYMQERLFSNFPFF